MVSGITWKCTTGIVYRNPLPHVVSKHAYFPSVVVSDNGNILVSFALGEAFEAVNLNTYISHSTDKGETWSAPQLLIVEEMPDVSQFARLCYLGSEQLVANISRCSRVEHPHEGLANPGNMGFVPTTLFTLYSDDFGKTWKNLNEIIPPLDGPCFEMCSSIVTLSDGKWLWPTSTWRDWNGSEPNGMKMVALISYNRGNTWPEYWTVMDNHASKIIYWESKIVELTKNYLLSVAWTYDERNGKDLDIHYSFSGDNGKTWSKPEGTGLIGQTVSIVALDDARVLIVYRRTDEPGLWAAVSSFSENGWQNLEQMPLWGTRDARLLEQSENMVQNFNELKFGAPSITRLAENEFFVVFWCYEKLVSNIRWIKLKLL